MANYATMAFDMIVQGVNWVADNWSMIAPIVMTVVTAILALNAVMLVAKAIQIALLLVQYWWVTLIVALAVAFLAFTEQVVGALWWLGALFKNIILFLGNLLEAVKAVFFNIMAWFINLVVGVLEAVKALAANAGIAFGNAWKGIQIGFNSLVSVVISGIKKIIDWLNKIPMVNIDTGGLSDKILGYAEKNAKLYASMQDYEDVGAAWNDGRDSMAYKDIGEAFGKYDVFSDGWGNDAYSRGAEVGANLKSGLQDKLGLGEGGLLNFGSEGLFGGMFDDFNLQFDPFGYDALTEGIGDLTAQQQQDADKASKSLAKGNKTGSKTAANTEKMADSLDIMTEEYAYMRDIAERRAINRFTTAKISVNMVNNNSIGGSMDMDTVKRGITDAIWEVIETSAEGVH